MDQNSDRVKPIPPPVTTVIKGNDMLAMDWLFRTITRLYRRVVASFKR